MASFTINFPTNQVARVQEALCAQIGFTAPGDITGANARTGLFHLIRGAVAAHESTKAVIAATAAAAAAPVDLT